MVVDHLIQLLLVAVAVVLAMHDDLKHFHYDLIHKIVDYVVAMHDNVDAADNYDFLVDQIANQRKEKQISFVTL